MEGWKNGRIENGEGIEKLDDIRDFCFLSYVFGLEGKKWRGEKLICLIENKGEWIENEVCIKLLSCSNYIIQKIISLQSLK